MQILKQIRFQFSVALPQNISDVSMISESSNPEVRLARLEHDTK